MTTPENALASSPLAQALAAASDKGFTGSVTATDQGQSVSVFVDDGLVYAVTSDAYAPPVHQFAGAAAGSEPPAGADPLAWAIEQGVLEDYQAESQVRDWAMGLLSSALTWSGAKVSRTRKVGIEHGTFAPTPWAVLAQDTSARISGLISSWGAITNLLRSQGIEARPASHACTRLVLTVAGHTHLTGELAVDDLACALGLTRHAVLTEAARAIITGQEVHLGVSPPSEGGIALVPEALEAPESEWASVQAAAEVTQDQPAVHVPDLQAPVVPEPQLPPVPEPAPEPAFAAEPDPDPEPVSEDHLLPAVIDAEVVEDPEPSTEVQPYAPDPLVALSNWATQADADEPQGQVRHEIFDGVLSSTEATTTRRMDELESLIAAMEQATGQARAAHEEHLNATGELESANTARREAQDHVQQVRDDGEQFLAAHRSAEAASSQAAADQEAAEQALAEAQQALDDATAAAVQARQAEQVAKEQVDQNVTVALQPAQAELERIETEVLAPATELVAEAAARKEELVAKVHQVGGKVMPVAQGAEASWNILNTIAPDHATLPGLYERLVQLHHRYQAAERGEEPAPHQPADLPQGDSQEAGEPDQGLAA